MIFRSDESGTTDNFQKYLDAASDGAWGKGAGKTFNGGQTCVGVDYVLVPRALLTTFVDKLKARLLSQRLRFMAGLSNWPSFSRGWSHRIADLLEA